MSQNMELEGKSFKYKIYQLHKLNKSKKKKENNYKKGFNKQFNS